MNQLADRVSNQKGLQLVNANIRRIAIQPAVRTLRGTTRRTGDDDDNTAVDAALLLVTAGVGAAPAACLSPSPKDLLVVGRVSGWNWGEEAGKTVFQSRTRREDKVQVSPSSGGLVNHFWIDLPGNDC